MAEGARLESVYTGNRIEGSNPSLSASRSAGYHHRRDRNGLPLEARRSRKASRKPAGELADMAWREETARSPLFACEQLLPAQAQQTAMCQTAMCNAKHRIIQRLSRRLMQAQEGAAQTRCS